jgi:PhzF family phenazine biosynthesis protein
VLPFTQVDVFTDRFMAGNPVAVVHGADDLSSDDMAAFARWTNLVETTFLLRPTQTGADYRLRIFTPRAELPFAGHPTLGSARAWLEAGGRARQEGQLIQECGAGLVPIRTTDGRLFFGAPPLVRSGPVSASDLARLTTALGIGPGDPVDAQWTDNGPGWVTVLLNSADAVLGLQPDRGGFGPYTSVGVVGPYPAGADAAFEVRAFIPEIGEGEDPVTGSLNAGIAQWLTATGRAPDSYVASQGTRLGRRGRVFVEKINGAVWVGGDTVLGVRGTVSLPPGSSVP